MKGSISGLLVLASLFIGAPLAHFQTTADYTSQYLPKVLSLSMIAPASTNVVCQNFISLWGGDPLGARIGENNEPEEKPHGKTKNCHDRITLIGILSGFHFSISLQLTTNESVLLN